MTVKRSKTSEVSKRLSVALKGMEGKSLKVGWVKGKIYPDSKSGMTTAQVAAIAESGSPKNNIPPRPILRPTIIREESKWKRIVTAESKKVLEGGKTAEEALDTLGLFAAGDVRDTITKIMSPPLQRSTVAARERKLSGRIKVPKGDPNAKFIRGQRKAQIKKNLASDTLWKPLVETGILLGSVTHSVEKK